MVLVGQDHMNLSAYSEGIQEDIWRAYPALDVVVTLTESDRAAYVQRLPDRPRFERIPNAARDMGPRRADLDAKLIVSAGRMTRQKGYDLLIPAFEQVLAKHPDWRLRIYGAGRERGNLRQMINERGLKDLIRLPKPVQDLGPELERAAIYVLSSRFEGLPLVLIEAMSKGLAVVSTDCPTGPRDIIEDRRNGLLVAFKDVDALAAGMLELIEDGDLRRRCAAAGIETARAYAPATVGAAWDALLAEVWSERFPGR
jgi:glycosyltransferase involved in cell wall biosynthesis